jgi:hypothetical protein
MPYESSPGKTTGNLYPNDYKTQKNHPDFTGTVEIDREQIENLIAQGKAGNTPKLRVAAWEYPSKQSPGKIRYFMSLEPPRDSKPKEEKPSNEFDDVPF